MKFALGFKYNTLGYACLLALLGVSLVAQAIHAQATPLCLDGFCIGQSIQNHRFSEVDWIVPKKLLTKERCTGVGCQPQNAFRGYPLEVQAQLAAAVSWKYGLHELTPILANSLDALRKYKYECNQSASSTTGERRFFGIYKSIPSGYFTVVGLRAIDGELKVYRIVREYPFHNQRELSDLAKQIKLQYGESILFYNYLSSNAYSDVITQRRNGWFARSSLFSARDLSDNTAELVLIDPKTRDLLEPSSMPESGEIAAIAAKIPPQCSREMPLQ